MTEQRKNGGRGKLVPTMELKSKEIKERKDASFSARFGRLASAIATFAGSPWMFLLAGVIVAIWGMLGPVYRYSDTWQLIINTGTTIVTFLMVFLIQNTQNRDARAIHLKLDEIIRSIQHAHNEMIDIERLSDKELAELSARYEKIREECERRERSTGKKKPAA
ncbi:MAG TPA: low affinity iron permease family protein [Terriglobales bacterium]|nr:low affinity iron permease family protein [Terriglobales bacterium]